tara:strand:+ start:303 stop:488 length:186 start_codon:yes stop_codon:yes gene_type:complete
MTRKEKKVLEAIKAVKEAEEALFNALFDIHDVEEAANASIRANKRFSDYMHFKYQAERGAA